MLLLVVPAEQSDSTQKHSLRAVLLLEGLHVGSTLSKSHDMKL